VQTRNDRRTFPPSKRDGPSQPTLTAPPRKKWCRVDHVSWALLPRSHSHSRPSCEHDEIRVTSESSTIIDEPNGQSDANPEMGPSHQPKTRPRDGRPVDKETGDSWRSKIQQERQQARLKDKKETGAATSDRERDIKIIDRTERFPWRHSRK